MSNEEDVSKTTAIEQAEVLLRGLRSGQIHSFIAVAVGDVADEVYNSGDLTARHVGTRLLGLLTIVQVRMTARFAASDWVRGPKG